MRFIDLFAGIGGFHYGLEQTNIIRTGTDKITKRNKHNGNSGVGGNEEQCVFRCVYSNEWDKYANSVYRRHYGECDNRDIRTVKARELPDFDLMCGGFPCQSFSIAGKRRGFEDTRGTLFFEMARIAKEKHPRLLLFENVKGLLSHDSGRTFAVIIQTLDELGYDLQWQVLNSKYFGVPQNRERIFIVGHLRGTPRPKVFPIRTHNKEDGKFQPKEDKQRAWIPCINSRYGQRWTGEGYIMRDGRDNRNCLRSGRTPEIGIKGMSIRRLTPIECERLQGFPDNWTQYGADGELISDTQRYKMCGNAVTTNVITEIAKRL